MGDFEDNLFALRFSFRLLRYWGWLGIEVIRSSIEVSRIILNPKLPINPHLIEVKTDSPDPIDHVIFGNSITLTPGTLTIDLHEGVVKVHTLTESAARELMEGEMNRRVCGMRRS